MKYLVSVLAAWGIVPVALAKSADNGPGLAQLPAAPVKNLYFRHDDSSYEAYKPEPFQSMEHTGYWYDEPARIEGPVFTGIKVNFNSKDYEVVIIKDKSTEHLGGVMKWR
jgi:hypothetical protein